MPTATAPPPAPSEGPDSLQSFLAELLNEQPRLQTPVAAYSAFHHKERSPALEPVYRQLIPLGAPAAGEQYAFEVDLDACSGCKACVAGCHALNGLDEEETWRDVGLVVGGDAAHPFQQTITSACHHCADPACLNGCPVLAYEKDPVTGIVRHLDDQCIGCSYCILQCPYDVPKYSRRLGIVRKCDLCHGRLAVGEAPACVQACPTHAIRVRAVPAAAAGAARVDTSAFLPGAPDPTRTQPTTRYVTRRALPANLAPADAGRPRPQPPHVPLVLMLVLTQLAVGLQLAAAVPTPLRHAWAPERDPSLQGAWILAAAGLTASVFHLGRPLRAWRIFLGLRRSWLSREAVVFGGWFPIASLAWVWPDAGWTAGAAAGAGVLGVFCSALIYIDTGRRAWRAPATGTRFFGTVATVAAFAFGPVAVAGVAGGKLGMEYLLNRRAPAATRLILKGPLRRLAAARRICAVLAAGTLLSAPIVGTGAVACGAVMLGLGELLERLSYFRAVDPSAMPGLSSP